MVIIPLTTPMYMNTQGTASNFQQRMANLRKENSQLVSQSQRLLDQLESSSNKLLPSNSTVKTTAIRINVYIISASANKQ